MSDSITDCVSGTEQWSGPLLLGFLFSYGLFGILCAQVFLYHIAFPNDARWLKTYVCLTFGLEVILTVFTTQLAWWSLGTGFGLSSRLFDLSGVPTDPAIGPLNAVLTSLYHSFYCWRIFKMTRNILVPIIIAALSSTQFIISIYVSARTTHKPTMDHNSNVAIITSAACIAVADIIVTTTMSIILAKCRKQTIHKATKTKLHQLIKFTVETGFTNSCASLVTIVFYFAPSTRDTYWVFAVWFMLGKLTSNSMMAVLNSRVLLSIVNTGSSSSSSDSSLRADGQICSTFLADGGLATISTESHFSTYSGFQVFSLKVY